ncbi:MAG: metallophosphoesterase [Deltaproteobacteria bacterium]|nr:metallophosphoesterase [Deltaproteobacteria bacterium]
MIRFLHTSDWQLGMTRRFLSEEAQARYTQARFDAIRTMGRIAKEKQCQFMLVCGDSFESNQVDRKTVARAIEALKEVSVPVYLLPSNHDPLNAASVYRSSTFIEKKPAHVHIIENAAPVQVGEGFELVGAPWLSKRPNGNPIVDLLNALPPAGSIKRICVGHGIIDIFTPDKEAENVIAVSKLEAAISEGKVHFIALGDRHSLTKVGSGDRIWYSGTPESTDFREDHSGSCQIVNLDGDHVTTEEVKIGQWSFIEELMDLNTNDDVDSLRKKLEDIPNRERSVVKLVLKGSLTLSLHGVLQNHILAAKDVLAGSVINEDDLHVIPNDTDFTNLGFSGFADATVKRLRDKIDQGGPEGTVARDAFMLLLRLSKEAA